MRSRTSTNRVCPKCHLSKLVKVPVLRSNPDKPSEIFQCARCGYEECCHIDPYRVKYRCTNTKCRALYANDESVSDPILGIAGGQHCPCCGYPCSG